MRNETTEKSPVQTAAEQMGAVIDWWTAPGALASIALGKFGLDMFRASLPKTAPSTFGKEDK
jgi:hypothetical protein